MKRIILLFFIPILVVHAYSADTLYLDDCYKEAIDNYPLTKGKDLLGSANELRIKNLQTNYLPQINLNGQATYQSDVVKLPINIPNLSIPELPKDQYKVSVDVNQIIYDGGITNSQKKLEEASLATDVQQIEVELYKIKERINQVYFTILLLQENERVLNLKRNELKDRLKVMESRVKNGVLTQSYVDILQAELLKVEQQMIEINIGKSTAFDILGEFMNKELSESLTLQLPKMQITIDNSINRPEYTLFDLQMNKIDASSKLLSTKRNPRLYGFGQFGYGRPGLNMLSDEFDSFYIVGAKFNWNLWDWNQNKKERQILSLQKDIINTHKETLGKNINISLKNEEATIQKLEEIIEKDYEIIALRSKITKASASQLENGVITSTDYITNLNTEIQAKINLESRKIQLVQSQINYLTIKGNQ